MQRADVCEVRMVSSIADLAAQGGSLQRKRCELGWTPAGKTLEEEKERRRSQEADAEPGECCYVERERLRCSRPQPPSEYGRGRCVLGIEHMTMQMNACEL